MARGAITGANVVELTGGPPLSSERGIADDRGERARVRRESVRLIEILWSRKQGAGNRVKVHTIRIPPIPPCR